MENTSTCRLDNNQQHFKESNTLSESELMPKETIALEFTGVNQATFDMKYGRIPPEKQSLKRFAGKLRESCKCSKQHFLSGLRRYVPVIDLVATYKPREYIFGDVVAGLSTAVMQIPQGMGLALLANLPPIIGLYTSFFPVLIYFVFGRSRHNSFGTNVISSLIIASSINNGLSLLLDDRLTPVAGNWSETTPMQQLPQHDEDFNNIVVQEKIRIALTVSLTAGLFLLIMFSLRLGIITSYISEPLYGGFLASTNVFAVTHQVKFMLGITIGSYSGPLSYFYTLRDICLNLKNTSIATLIISIVAIVILILVKKLINERYARRLKTPVPIDLIVVVIATIISYFCDFNSRFSVKIIEVIPQGLPNPAVPSMKNFDLYLLDGATLGLINYIFVFMMAEIYASKYSYPLDANQELLATGLCAVFGSFFSCMAASTSPPRCILHDQSGGHTQLAQLVSAVFLLLTLLFISPLFQALPICILSAMIVVSVLPLFRYNKACVEYWKTSKVDFVVWLVAHVTTLLLDVGMGITLGLVASILSVVARTQLPYTSQMKLVPGDRFMVDDSKYPGSAHDGLLLFRFEAPLYFATIDIFKNKLHAIGGKPRSILEDMKKSARKGKLTEDIEGKTQRSQQLRVNVEDLKYMEQLLISELECGERVRQKTIILDCSAMPFVDTAGAKTLALLHNEYKQVEIRFLMANIVETVRDTLTRTDSCSGLVASEVYPSVYDAIVASRLGTQCSKDGNTEH